jgi:hypothetical protein
MIEGKKPSRSKPVRASLEFARSVVFYDDGPCQRKFTQKCGAEIDAFVLAIHEAHSAVEAAGGAWPRTERAQSMLLFLHVALNNLYCSVHFLVSGYFQAAGQQARSYGEACAMAMLLIADDEWPAFQAQGTAYPAHKAIERVKKRPIASLLSTKLGLELTRWADFQTITRSYDQHSHAGAFSVALHLNLSTGATIIAGEFDPAKLNDYRDLLRRSTGGARSLGALVNQIGRHIVTIA